VGKVVLTYLMRVQSLRSEARAWTSMYGKELYSIARGMLLEASNQIDRFVSVLQQPIIHIDDVTRAHTELISSEVYAVSGGPHLGAIEMIAEWLEALSIGGSIEIRNDLTKLHDKIGTIRSVRLNVIQGFKQAQMKLLSAMREESNRFTVSVSQLRNDLFGAKGPIQSLGNVTFSHDASTPFRVLQKKVSALQEQLVNLHNAETASELPHTDGKELEFLDEVIERYNGLFDLYDDLCEFVKSTYTLLVMDLTIQLKGLTSSAAFQFGRSAPASELHKLSNKYEALRSRLFGLPEGSNENALFEWMKSLTAKHLAALRILGSLQHVSVMTNSHWKEWKQKVADDVAQSMDNNLGTLVRPSSTSTYRGNANSGKSASQIISFMRPWRTMDMGDEVYVGDVLESLQSGFPASELSDIAGRAAQENAASHVLKRINFEWTTEEFVFVHEDTNRNERHLFQIVDVQWAHRKLLQMEDDLASLGEIHLKSKQSDVEFWKTRLFNARHSLQQFLTIQDEWLKYRYYLRTLSALHRSNVIEQQLVGLFNQMRDRPNVIEFCSDQIFSGSILSALSASLDDIRKSLFAVLDSYRSIFPRLNFVDDSDIVNMQHFLSMKPTHLDRMYPLLFTGIAKIVIQSDVLASGRRDTSLSYSEALDCNGNRLQFTAAGLEKQSASIPVDRNLPVFLSTLCHAMQGTVSQQICDVNEILSAPDIKNFALQQSELEKLCNFSSQAAHIGLRCLWTSTCENAIDQASKSDVSSSLTFKQILRCIQTNILLVTELIKINTRRSQLVLLCALFLTLRDATERLDAVAPKNKEDFDFSIMLRNYHASEAQRQSSWVSMLDSNFLYGNEWEGDKTRLVLTPCSLRLFLSIFQSLRGGFGACLTRQSPERSGIVEELGRLLGCFCCFKKLMSVPTENMAFEVGRALKGISRNEFHAVLAFEDLYSLPSSSLSIACSQIGILLHQYVAEGGGFCIIPSVEITTIPPILCYLPPRQFDWEADRMPECMRQLFRPAGSWLSKTLDRVHILSVTLASYALQDHLTVARRINAIFEMSCSHPILRSKMHLFSHSSSIKIARYLINAANRNEDGDLVCSEFLLDAFQSLICIYLEPEEMKAFDTIVRVIIGTKQLQFSMLSSEDQNIDEIILQKLDTCKLQRNPSQIDGISRLLQNVLNQCAVVVVGAPLSGKTTSINMAKSLLLERIPGAQRLRSFKFCPTSINMDRLFGDCDADGGLTRWLKEMQPTADITLSIVELESYSIDKYCLDMLVPMICAKEYHILNNCRMEFKSKVKFIFEIGRLGHMTPALAGQFGIFSVSQSVLQAEHVLRSWQSQSVLPNMTGVASSLLEVYFASTIKFCIKEISSCIRADEDGKDSAAIVAMQRALRILEASISRFFSATAPSFSADNHREVLERLVVFATVWGLAGLATDTNERRKFSVFMQHATSIVLPPDFREEDCLHDWFVDDSGMWQSWSKSFGVKDQMDDFFGDFKILVPTAEMCCQHSLLTLLGTHQEQNSLFKVGDSFQKGCKGIIIFGRQGCGKSVVLRSISDKIGRDISSGQVGLYSSITSSALQVLLEQYLQLKNGAFVVKENKIPASNQQKEQANRFFWLIEDVHLAKSRDCECPFALIRSLISENKGLFGLAKNVSNSFVKLNLELSIVCSFSLAKANGFFSSEYHDDAERPGIDIISNKCFSVNMTDHSHDGLLEICSTIMNRKFATFLTTDSACLDCICRASVSMLTTMASLFPSSIGKCHCVFDIRRLLEIMYGMQLAMKVATISDLVNLWLHECKRAFLDWTNSTGEDLKTGIKVIGAVASTTRTDNDISLLNFVDESTFEEDSIGRLEFSSMAREASSPITKLAPITDTERDGSRHGSEADEVEFEDPSLGSDNVESCKLVDHVDVDDGKGGQYCECTDFSTMKAYLLRNFGIAHSRNIRFNGEVYLFDGSVLFLNRLQRAVNLVQTTSAPIIIIEKKTGNALNALKLVTANMNNIKLMDLTSTYSLVQSALNIAKQCVLQNEPALAVCSADQNALVQDLVNLLDFGRLDMYLGQEDMERLIRSFSLSSTDGRSAQQHADVIKHRLRSNLRIVVSVLDQAFNANEAWPAHPSFLFYYPDLTAISKRAIVLFEPSMEPNDYVVLARRCVEKVSKNIGPPGLPVHKLALHLGAIPSKAVGLIKLENPIDDRRRNAQIVCSSRYALFLREFQRIMLAKAQGLLWRHSLLFKARDRIDGVEVE
jgi:hypothetical protein